MRCLTIAARLRRWYTSERHGSTGKGTESHCNLKSGIVKRMANQPNHTDYRSIVGTISFIAGSARPECSYVAKELARNLSNPTADHMRAAKRCAQYMYTTRYDGVTYDQRMSHEPIAYCDADFANQLSNRRSTTGRVIMLYGAAIVWSSRQQRTVALSTAEAEYYALGDLGRDIVWVRRLMADLGPSLTRLTPARA